jgi:enoyl-CoA hydratase/carnithine racemase
MSEDSAIAEITLSGPNGNSLDGPGITALAVTLGGLNDSTGLRVIVLSGSGEDFCGGRRRDASLFTKEEIATDLAPILAVNDQLDRLTVPIIAAVEGRAHGFGFGLATLCDITIAAKDSRFALTELAHGIPPLIVLSYLVRMIPYKVALGLAMSGRELNAAEACELGIVSDVCATGESLSRARTMASTIAQLPQPAVSILRTFARGRAGLYDAVNSREGADIIASLLATEHSF